MRTCYNRYMKTRIAHLSLLVLTGATFMGIALPNTDTAVLGNDVRNGNSSLYELNISAPETSSAGETVEVRVSFEHADGLPLRSSGRAVVTGGDLLNQQQQKLTPDAVWQIRVGTTGTVGVILSISTEYLNDRNIAEATYVDTLTKKVVVQRTDSATATVESNFPAATQLTTLSWIGGILGALVIALTVIVVLALRKKTHS